MQQNTRRDRTAEKQVQGPSVGRHCYTSIRLVIMKKKKVVIIRNTGKDAKKLDLLYIADGNINGTITWETVWQIFKKY